MACNLRARKSIAARCTVNVGTIRRMTDGLAPGMGVNGCVIVTLPPQGIQYE